jgi:hypothetical protein
MKTPKEIYFELCDKYIETKERAEIVEMAMIQYANEFNKSELKKLGLCDVIGQSEMLCTCKNPEINDMRWACNKCGKDFDDKYKCA